MQKKTSKTMELLKVYFPNHVTVWIIVFSSGARELESQAQQKTYNAGASEVCFDGY